MDFEAVYAVNAQMVYWTAYGITHNKHTAADITQATFLKVCERWSILQNLDGAQQRSYIFKTCRGLSINRFRQDKKMGEALTQEDYPSDAPLLEELAEERELVGLVRKSVHALPELYRTALMLHYYAELSTAEAAQLLKIPTGTYRSRLSRARTLLKEILEAEVNRYE
ncbi:MAG TPA: RNA polymerase sigma factor [Clostridia bacterium]|nr:RNA polymerase sigma factor [Clostridia bacterium]